MLKVSDKLLCKKDFIRYSIVSITKGKYYTIRSIDSSDDDDIGVQIKYNDKYSLSWWFSYNIENDWYIWDYFYTDKEIRKMKLNQLKCLK